MDATEEDAAWRPDSHMVDFVGSALGESDDDGPLDAQPGGLPRVGDLSGSETEMEM